MKNQVNVLYQPATKTYAYCDSLLENNIDLILLYQFLPTN